MKSKLNAVKVNTLLLLTICMAIIIVSCSRTELEPSSSREKNSNLRLSATNNAPSITDKLKSSTVVARYNQYAQNSLGVIN